MHICKDSHCHVLPAHCDVPCFTYCGRSRDCKQEYADACDGVRCCNAESMRWTSSRTAWALTDWLTGITVSCLGAILLPYFDILAAMMGALGNLVAAYALPALFTLVSTLLLKSLLAPADATGSMATLCLPLSCGASSHSDEHSGPQASAVVSKLQ